MIAIGIPEDLVQLIYRLHRCGLEVPQWSPLQPIPETNSNHWSLIQMWQQWSIAAGQSMA